MSLKDKLNSGAKILGAIAVPVVATVALTIMPNPYNAKAMPGVQPWRFLYDTNKDGRLGPEDKVMVGVVGPGGCKAGYHRSPTDKEIEWYNSN